MSCMPGKGVIISDMAYMDSIETVCEVCHGTRYSEEVLKYQYKGKNIDELKIYRGVRQFGFLKTLISSINSICWSRLDWDICI